MFTTYKRWPGLLGNAIFKPASAPKKEIDAPVSGFNGYWSILFVSSEPTVKLVLA